MVVVLVAISTSPSVRTVVRPPCLNEDLFSYVTDPVVLVLEFLDSEGALWWGVEIKALPGLTMTWSVQGSEPCGVWLEDTV